MIKAKNIVQGKIQLENLPEPYLFFVDGTGDRLALVVSNLTAKNR
jgi:hypothetical protein